MNECEYHDAWQYGCTELDENTVIGELCEAVFASHKDYRSHMINVHGWREIDFPACDCD